MDGTSEMESHLSSAAAFVEGGIQDACDDACSICLDAFCENNPSTVLSSYIYLQWYAIIGWNLETYNLVCVYLLDILLNILLIQFLLFVVLGDMLQAWVPSSMYSWMVLSRTLYAVTAFK